MKFQGDLDEDIRQTQARLDSLYAEREKAPARPAEPPVGSVVKFQVQHSEEGIVYTYAAFHFAPGSWRLSSTNTTGKGGISWGAVVQLMSQDHAVRNGHRRLSYHVAHKWKEVVL